jgi:hypothetical protein
MENIQLLGESVRTQMTDLEPTCSIPSDGGPVFVLRGEIPSPTIVTRAGWED